MDTSYLEFLESERFGRTRSRAEHLAALELERHYTYVKPSSEPSVESVELLRRNWSRIRFKLWQIELARKIMRGK